MKVELTDGAGKGYLGKIGSDNRLYTSSVIRTQIQQATIEGNTYNVNTGTITLSGTTRSGVLYIKNNESRDLHIDTIVVILGPSTGGASTDTTFIEFVRNPTTGTLISGASEVDMNQNRNFGSSNTLTVDAYKGAHGNTITDGTNIIESLVSPGSRAVFSIDLLLPQGSSLGVAYTAPASNTNMEVQCAAICRLEDNS
jgi:hypothetical protein